VYRFCSASALIAAIAIWSVGCSSSSSNNSSDSVLQQTAEKSCELADGMAGPGDMKSFEHHLSGNLNPEFVDEGTFVLYTPGVGYLTYKFVCDGRFDDTHTNATSVVRSRTRVGSASNYDPATTSAAETSTETSSTVVTSATLTTQQPTNAPETPPSDVIPNTDFQGFLPGSGPRCDGSDKVRFIGISKTYQVLVCHADGAGSSYIRTRDKGTNQESTYPSATGEYDLIAVSGPLSVDVNEFNGIAINNVATKVIDETWEQRWKE
jgi:hypothetical protein